MAFGGRRRGSEARLPRQRARALSKRASSAVTAGSVRRHESVSRAKHSRSVHLPFSSRFTHLPPCPPPPPPPPLAATALTLAKRAATRSILIFLRCSVGDCDYKLAAPRNGFFIWPPFFEYKTNVFCAKKSGGALGRAGGGRLRRGRALSSLGMFTRPTVRELRGESLGRRGRRGVRVCAFALWVCGYMYMQLATCN